jgi:preprotein translocase subunit SecD
MVLTYNTSKARTRFVVSLLILFILSGCDYVKQSFEDKVTLTLEVDSDWVVQSKLEFLAKELQAFLDDRKIRYLSLHQQEATVFIKYEFDQKLDVATVLKQEFPEFSISNTDVMLEPENRQIIVSLPDKTRADLVELARNYNSDVVVRILHEKDIQVETKNIGSDRFSISIPESTYSDELVSSLLFNESLAFYLAEKTSQPDSFAVKDKNGNTLYLKRPGVITGDAIINAEASHDNMNNQPSIMVVLDTVGAHVMEKITRENIGRQMAVVLIDNSFGEKGKRSHQKIQVISVATIQGVFGKRFMITGLENMKEAEAIAEHIRAGEFAAPMKLVTSSSSKRTSKTRGEAD